MSRRYVVLAASLAVFATGSMSRAGDLSDLRKLNANRFVPSLGNDGLVGVSSSETMGHLNFAIKTIFGFAGDPLKAMLDGKSTLEAVASQFRIDLLLCMGFSDFFDLCGQPPLPIVSASCGGIYTLGNVPKIPGTGIGDVRIMPRVNLPILRNRVLAQVKRLNKKLHAILTEFGQVGKMVEAAKKKVREYEDEVNQLRREAEGLVGKLSREALRFLDTLDGGVPSIPSLPDGGVFVRGFQPDGGVPSEALHRMGTNALEREKALRLAQLRRRLGAILPIYNDAVALYKRFEERRAALMAMIDQIKKSLTVMSPGPPTGIGFGFIPEFTIPTATENSNAGEAGATFTPTFLLDYRWANGSFFGSNLAIRFRPETIAANIHSGHEILLGVGGNLRLHPRWEVLAEAQFALGLAGGALSDQVSLEGTLGGTHRFCNGFYVNASYGRGILTNWGTPDQRIMAGFGYGPKPPCAVPVPRDRDGDGVPDVYDTCPSVYGTRLNGCPEPPLPPPLPPAPEPEPEPVSDPEPPPELERAPALLPDPEPAPARELPPPPDRTIRERLEFASGRAVILRVSHAALRQIAAQVKSFGRVRVRVVGHSDERGNANHNLRLSQQRSRAIGRFLVGEGLSPDQLVIEGKGSTAPLERGCGKRRGAAREACYRANRRVEFIIME